MSKRLPWWKRIFRRSKPVQTQPVAIKPVKPKRAAILWEEIIAAPIPTPIPEAPKPAAPVRPKTSPNPPAILRDPVPTVPRAQGKLVEDVLKEDAQARREYGSPAYLPTKDHGIGTWAVSSEPKETFVKVAHNEENRRYAIVMQIDNRWWFWTGPRKKLFTRLGEDEIWSCTDKSAALIVAGFLQNGCFGTVVKS